MAANFNAVKEEAKRYADEVRRHLPVDKVYLFGSYAKGTADELSDVDVGIFLLKIASDYKAYFEPLVFETSEIELNNPFVNEILHTGLEL